MRVTPMTGAVGAEIDGLALTGDLTAAAEDDLRDALAAHGVLVFRGQALSVARQKEITAIFGPLTISPYITPAPGEPALIRVLKEADERAGGVFGGGWHSDLSFLEEPPAGSVLTAVEVPPSGGDTLFAGGAAAWAALPEPLQDLLAERDAIHVGKPYGVKWAPPVEERAGGSIEMRRGDPTADEERRHPAAPRCPRSGRRTLFLNPTYVTRLDGLSEEQSRPLLAQIQEHATRPEFCVRLRWRAGDVAIWSNLLTQHYAVNDYAGHRRLMHRTVFGGPRPTRQPPSSA